MIRFEVQAINRINELYRSPACFLVEMHCEVVKLGEIGGEAFRAYAVSPAYLSTTFAESNDEFPLEFGRGLIIVNEYNEPVVLEALQRLIDRSGQSDWQGLQQYVEKFFDWI